MKKDNWIFEMSSGYSGYRCKKCGTWRYANETKICFCNKIMKNKKHKVKISKEKVVIKPTPGHEIDKELICKINRHYEHDGIFKPIKKELPKTWEEFCRLGYNKLKGQIDVSGQWSPAFNALWKLVLLRDHYNDGWVPDWHRSNDKYCLAYFENKIISSAWEGYQQTLAFETVYLRDEFLLNFRELIETAKPLL